MHHCIKWATLQQDSVYLYVWLGARTVFRGEKNHTEFIQEQCKESVIITRAKAIINYSVKQHSF